MEPEIARITEVNGTLWWTGDGGQVVSDLYVGRSLPGGTLESLSAESWAVWTFRDGSTVTISGPSLVTISEQDQKELHFQEGRLSANVTPQPKGRPMLIHTPTAELEVRGTQLNVDAEPASTVLTVNEGSVRVTRLAEAFSEAGQVFDIELRLEDFQSKEYNLADGPVGLELTDWLCFTTNEDVGLEIVQVELLPPAGRD